MGKTVRKNDKHSSNISRLDRIHQRGVDDLEEFYRDVPKSTKDITKNIIKDNYVPEDKDPEIPSDEDSFES